MYLPFIEWRTLYFSPTVQAYSANTFANRKYEELSYYKTQKMCDPILVNLLKMRPFYSQYRRENAIPSSSKSPLASYKEVLPPGSLKIIIGDPRRCIHIMRHIMRLICELWPTNGDIFASLIENCSWASAAWIYIKLQNYMDWARVS